MDEKEKSRIYVTGDCHGEYQKLSKKSFPVQREMTKADYVIITGDFGYWNPLLKEQQYWLRWLEERAFSVLWIDGNHENFALLNQIPVTSWHGGYVQFISPTVIHLMRGQVYEIAGKKIFTFGGASSHDADVILDENAPELKRKIRGLRTRKIPYRIRNVEWWEQELPSQEEMDEGIRNLQKHNWEVDFVFSHCCAGSIQRQYFGTEYKEDVLTEYLETIRQKCSYHRWFFGHYHQDILAGKKETAVYRQMIRIV